MIYRSARENGEGLQTTLSSMTASLRKVCMQVEPLSKSTVLS